MTRLTSAPEPDRNRSTLMKGYCFSNISMNCLGRAEMIQLPPGLHVLMDPLVIAVACIMYVIEFFVDKVPYVDSAWDTLHTFIRIPGGAILAARSLGPTNPALELAAILAGGTVALAAHGTKATLRLALN